MDYKIVQLAYSFDAWVFGGWIRDKLILKSDYNDIDICFPTAYDINVYIKCLSVLGNVDVKSDKTYNGFYMNDRITRRVYLVINGEYNVDITAYDGSLSEWLCDRTVDMTCNLFYSTSTVSLGIRYVPDVLKYAADPADLCLAMTRKKEFMRIWGEKDTPEKDIISKNVHTINSRINKMQNRGWEIKNDCMTEQMFNLIM